MNNTRLIVYFEVEQGTGAKKKDHVKHEGALYKEVFPGKIEAHLSVTVKVHESNSKWRAI